MSKLAKIIFISLPVLISWYLYIHHSPVLGEISASEIESSVKNDEVKIEAAAVQKNIPQNANPVGRELSLKHTPVESQINETTAWHLRIEKEAKLINQDWHELMKYHLSSLNEDKTEELFNQYMKETAEFNRVVVALSSKLSSLTDTDEDEGLYQKNQKLISETVQKLNKEQSNHKAKVKKIFGTYYTQLFEVHKTYAQGLPNHEWMWNDFGFIDDD